MKDQHIPFYRTPITKKQISAVVRTLKSGWLTTGAVTHELEAKMADYLGVKYAVGVSSCTAGLHLALVAAGIKPGDEVVTTPFTFIASVEPIVHIGATPVFADIDPDSFNLCPREAAGKITERTKAVMPVHIAGLPCELTALASLAKKQGLRMIHDAAHAIGAEYRGRKIGAIPDITSFSFYATKNITTGEGGMVTTPVEKWAGMLRMLSLHGMDRQAWKRHQMSGSWYYEIKALGYKYNLADLNASIGLAQLEDFADMQKLRARAVRRYDELLADIDEITIPPRNSHTVHAWHLYVIRIDTEKISIGRNEVIAEMAKAGVSCGVHFIPVFKQPYYRKRFGLKSRDFPRTCEVYKRVISLPLFPGIKGAEIAEVVRRLKGIIRRHRRRRIEP